MSYTFVRTSIGVFLGLVIALVQAFPAGAADGALDPTFGDGGIVTTDIGGNDDLGLDVAVQPDGRIIMAGTSMSSDGADNDFGLVRYHPDGSLDTTFDLDGKVSTDIGNGYDLASAIALGPDGKIIAAGYANNGNDMDFALARYHPDGSLDTTFGVDGRVITPAGSGDDYGTDAALQPDGKIVVVGFSFNDASSGDALSLARYNPDGSLDETFGSQGIVMANFGCGAAGHALALQPDGKIVVAGDTCGVASRDFALARFNGDGSPDTTFEDDGLVTTDFGNDYDSAHAIAVQPDGRIVLAGHSSTDMGAQIVFALARYHGDGSLDTSFDEDGKVTTDLGGWRDIGNALVLQPDGRILVAGEQWQETGAVDFALARYNGDGSLDPAFDADGIVITDISSGDYASGLALQPDGRILVAGWSDNGFNFDFALARYESSGSVLEATLDVRPGKFPNRIELEKNVCRDNDNLPVAILTTPEFDALQLVDATSLQMGDPALGGRVAPIHSQGRDIDRDGDTDVWLLFALCDLVTNNALDENSTELVLTGITLDGVPFTARDSVEIIGRKPPRPIVPVFDYPVDGQVLDYEGSYLFRVQPIPSADGFLWGFFQNGEMVWENYRDEGVLSGNEYGIHPGTPAHSKFVPGPVEVWVRASIDGQWTEAAVITIHLVPTGGPLDPTFGTGGIVTTDFDGFDNIAEDVAVQTDGKILVAGFISNGLETDFALARYNADGSPDTTFGDEGRVITEMGERDEFGIALIVQPDGRIIVAGSAHNGSDSDIVLARYNPDGSLDASFGVGGKVIHPDATSSHYAMDAVLQPDGKVVVTGYAFDESGNQDILLYRYEENGSPDTSFGSNGIVVLELGCSAAGHAVALQPDGKMLVAGKHCGSIFNEFEFALVRFNGDGSLDVSFDGDGILTTYFEGGLAEAYGIAIQPDGRIVIAGQSYTDSETIVFALARYNSDGSPDTTFGIDGKVTTDPGEGSEVASAITLQPDGKIVVAGENATVTGSDFLMRRYNSDGSLDTTFGDNGEVITDIRVSDYGISMAQQADGKIVLTGTGTDTYNHDFKIILARYQVGAAAQEVTIDIRPDSRTNHVNPRSSGLIHIAILSTPELDTLTGINLATIRFGRTGVEASLHSCKEKGRDVNHDGLRDLICLFSIQATDFQQGDETGVLTGWTVDGLAITGHDSIRIAHDE